MLQKLVSVAHFTALNESIIHKKQMSACGLQQWYISLSFSGDEFFMVYNQGKIQPAKKKRKKVYSYCTSPNHKDIGAPFTGLYPIQSSNHHNTFQHKYDSLWQQCLICVGECCDGLNFELLEIWHSWHLICFPCLPPRIWQWTYLLWILLVTKLFAGFLYCFWVSAHFTSHSISYTFGLDAVWQAKLQFDGLGCSLTG